MTPDTPPAENPALGLFKRYLTERARIFRNREVLRHSYRPQILPHRMPQIDEIASILAPSLLNETPSNILIYGKTGTGKTACVRYVGGEAREGLEPDLALHGRPHQLRGDRHPVSGARSDRKRGRASRRDLVRQAPDPHPDDRLADGSGLPRAQEPARGPGRRARDRARRDRQARQEERRRHTL